ncbi:MAG: hypothetical protein R3E45_02075, partial [Rhodocyclaceae bacterium]
SASTPAPPDGSVPAMVSTLGIELEDMLTPWMDGWRELPATYPSDRLQASGRRPRSGKKRSPCSSLRGDGRIFT